MLKRKIKEFWYNFFFFLEFLKSGFVKFFLFWSNKFLGFFGGSRYMEIGLKEENGNVLV